MKTSSRDADAYRRDSFLDEPIGPPESPSGLGDIPGLPPYDRESISYEIGGFALIWGYVRGFYPPAPARRRRLSVARWAQRSAGQGVHPGQAEASTSATTPTSPLPKRFAVNASLRLSLDAVQNSGRLHGMDETKLTIRIDRATLESAKRYAQAHGTSLTRLVTSHLERLGADDGTSADAPVTRRLTGVLPADASPQDYWEHIERKHAWRQSGRCSTST